MYIWVIYVKILFGCLDIWIFESFMLRYCSTYKLVYVKFCISNPGTYLLTLFSRAAWYFSFHFTEVMTFLMNLLVSYFVCLFHLYQSSKRTIFLLVTFCYSYRKIWHMYSWVLANIYGQNIYFSQSTCVKCIHSLLLFNSRIHCVKNKGRDIQSENVLVLSLLAKVYKQCDRGFISSS